MARVLSKVLIMRRYIRHPVDIPIEVTVASEEAIVSEAANVSERVVDAVDSVGSYVDNHDNSHDENCNLRTISQGGLSCEVAQEFAVGSSVDIDIPSVSPPYHGQGVVVWCKPNGKENGGSVAYEIGVRFIDDEEAFKSRMVQQICQIEHYKNIVFEREGRIIDGNEAAAEWINKYAESFD